MSDQIDQQGAWPAKQGPEGHDGFNLTRRRWLTSMLSGPAVVSLPATASAAAFGSLGTCVENLHSNQYVQLHVGSQGMDGYARAYMQGYLVERGGGNGYASQAIVEYQSGKYFDADYNEWRAIGNDKYESPTGETFKFQGTYVDRYSLMFAAVDDFGEMVSLEPDSQKWDYMPVTTSCYVSIAPIQL